MALNLSKTGIATTQTIEAWHVTQSIDALTGAYAYNLTISGSLNATGSVITGSISNAVTASHALTASNASSSLYAALSGQTNTLKVNNTATTNQNFRLVFAFETGMPAPNNAAYVTTAVDSGSDGSGLYYNPQIDTLYAANVVGTASWAGSSSFATTSSYSFVQGTVAPSGSSSGSSIINFIAGATQTDTSVIPTVTVYFPELTSKVLGRDCFVTTGMLGTNISNQVTISSLSSGNLTFVSQNISTDFHYQIIYI